MKKLTVILASILLVVACDNATDGDQNDGPDTTSSLPAPASVDTNSLKPDSPKVERALRK